MGCAFDSHQVGRTKRLNPVAAMGILAAPLLGAALYLRPNDECDACHRAAASPVTPGQTDSGGWSRLAATKLDGSHFAMAGLAGKPAILYFWATWCPQCRVQRKVLEGLAALWGDQVRTVALSVDDDASAIERYLAGHAMLSHELLASSELLERFDVEALPTLALIDAGGQVKSVSAGPMDAEQLRSAVEPLLK